MPEIRTRDVLQAVLLQTLKDFKEGAQIGTVYEQIESHFTFPHDWLREIPASAEGYEELKNRGMNWRDVRQEELIQIVHTEPQWQNEIRWARNNLRKLDYLDATTPRGIWKLTNQGFRAAGASLQNLTPAEKQIATPRSQREPRKPSVQRNLKLEPGLPLRDAMERKLELLTSSMPLDDLQLLVDIARAIRLRSIGE